MNQDSEQPKKVSARHSQPKRSGQKPYHHGDLKETLIAATLELVEERGPRGFSLAEVCRQAGVSVAAPYRHFHDKESLLAAVAESSFVIFRRHMEGSIAVRVDGEPMDPFNALRALAGAYVEFAIRNPARFRVMFSAQLHKSRFPELFATARSAFDLTLHALEECRKANPSSTFDTYTLAVSFWSQCHGLAVLAVDGYLREIAMEQRLSDLLALTVDRFLEALSK